MTSKLILVVGMKFVGSIMLINLIKNILAEGQISTSVSYLAKSIPPKKGNKYHLVKFHGYYDEFAQQADIIFNPIRDLRDSCITGINRKITKRTNQGMNKMIRKNITRFNNWNKYPEKTVIFKYEAYKSDLEGGVRLVAKKLGIELDQDAILRVIQKTEKILDNYKLGSLMKQGNITSGGKMEKWRDYFSQEENQLIVQDQQISNFLTKYGYPLY